MLRKELAEYHSLCNTLGRLHLCYEKQKTEVSGLFNQLLILRTRLQKELGKTRSLLRHMTLFQKKQIALQLESKKLKLWENDEILFLPLLKPELNPVQIQDYQLDQANIKEIKTEEVRLINMIDGIKKKQLRLELIGMRLRELLLAVGKILETYKQQWKQIYWTIFPFGIFSVLYKSLRKMTGKHYYTSRDLNDIAVISNLCTSILKMANAPII